MKTTKGKYCFKKERKEGRKGKEKEEKKKKGNEKNKTKMLRSHHGFP